MSGLWGRAADGAKNLGAKWVGVDHIRSGAGVIADSARELKATCRRASAARRAAQAQQLDMSDFRVVLDHWGIQEHEVQRVCNCLLILAFFGVLCVVWGGYTVWFAERFLDFWMGTVFIIFGVVQFVTRFWRAWVLETRHFVPFFKWVTFRG